MQARKAQDIAQPMVVTIRNDARTGDARPHQSHLHALKLQQRLVQRV